LPGARVWEPGEAAAQVVGGHLQTVGPSSAEAITSALGLSASGPAAPGLDRARVDAALAALEADGQILQGRFEGGEVEWCERRILQRIHRRTLGVLREQIRPVSPAELIRFLLRWQHLQPGARLHGAEGVLRVIEQLEGLELQPAAWERDVLPARIEGYQPAWLDELCLSGEVAWARLRVTPPEPDEPRPAGMPGDPAEEERRRPRGATGAIGLFLRAHAGWLIDPHARTDEPPASWAHLSPLGRRVAGQLERRGAAFAGELASALGEPAAAVEDALWELVRTGAVTSDGFSGLRALIGPASSASARLRRALQGRWSLLHRDAVPRGDPETREDGAFGDGSPVELARLYLRRYGIVMRALLARESAAPPWRELVSVYRRLEARGEIRGGRFVSGQKMTGEQFALPEAVEALRALAGRPSAGEEVSVAATDPLNLVGILTPGPRVPSVAGHAVRYRGGVPDVELRELSRSSG
jgi:ATP-dependent Lhr-like helicase